MSRRLTTEKFVQKAKEVHGDRYEYSLIEYVNDKTAVTIICRDHGPFLQRPGNHTTQKTGCPRCGGVKRLTTVTFIEKAKAVHGDRYDYSLVEYLNNKTAVTINCRDHGSFSQRPDKHLAPQGCPDCGGNKQHTTETFKSGH